MAQLMKCCAISAIVFGIAAIVISIVGFTLFPRIVSSKIKEKIALHEDSDSFARWKHLSVPMFMQFYFFDVQNAEDVMNGVAKPIVVQKGPYVFREVRDKINVVVNETLGTLTYNLVKGFYFDAELSVGPLSESVTVVDVTTATLVRKIEKLRFGLSLLGLPYLDGLLRHVNRKAFHKYTIEELILGHPIKPIEAIVDKLNEFGIPFNILPTKFGLLMDKNFTAEGHWVIDSGIHDINNLQKLISFNHEKQLSKWNDEYCDMINGTDGSRFHPEVEPTDILRAFTPDICRSITLVYEQKSQVEGIKTLRYRLPDKFWAAPNREPDNKCFCTSNDENICGYDGIMDISACRKGAPVFISGPHFLKGDPRLFKAIDGLKIDESRHDTYIDVEPLTGAVLNAARRIQLNVHLKPNNKISFLSNLKEDLIMPLAWLDEVATIDPVMAGKLRVAIFDKLKLFKILAIVGCCVGIVMVVVGLVLWFLQTRKKLQHCRLKVVHFTKGKMFK